MSAKYQAVYELYIPKLGDHNWRSAGSVEFTATYTATNFTQAFERANTIKPEHSVLISVAPY